MLTPNQLKEKLRQGLLAFPVTPFTNDNLFDKLRFKQHINYLLSHKPSAIFVGSGTGEFFSLSLEECDHVNKIAVSEKNINIPIIAGTGYGSKLATIIANNAEQTGVDGILVLPPYLLEIEPEGLFQHIYSICQSISIGVIVYHRGNAIYSEKIINKLAEKCDNFIGFKDGIGDLELVARITNNLGDRIAIMGGIPTAELYAVPMHSIGINTYSSAVFNFLPDTANKFFKAVIKEDKYTTDKLINELFLPIVSLRKRKKGYAVSMIKSGLRIIGKSAGHVRAPLLDLTDEDENILNNIIKHFI